MRRRKPAKPPLPEGQTAHPPIKNGAGTGSAPLLSDEINLTFKDLMRASYREEDIPALIAQQQRSDDRTVCILMAGMLERNLEYLIITRASFGFSLNQKWREHLFMKDGALSSFRSKIYLARLLDLISDATMRDLDIIREIRNRFAHSALPLHFKIKSIRDKLSTLRYGEYSNIALEEHLYSRLTKERREYIYSCFMILHEMRDMVDRIEELIEEMHDGLEVMRDVRREIA